MLDIDKEEKILEQMCSLSVLRSVSNLLKDVEIPIELLDKSYFKKTTTIFDIRYKYKIELEKKHKGFDLIDILCETIVSEIVIKYIKSDPINVINLLDSVLRKQGWCIATNIQIIDKCIGSLKSIFYEE